VAGWWGLHVLSSHRTRGLAAAVRGGGDSLVAVGFFVDRRSASTSFGRHRTPQIGLAVALAGGIALAVAFITTRAEDDGVRVGNGALRLAPG
jgi:hypothetical protein